MKLRKVVLGLLMLVPLLGLWILAAWLLFSACACERIAGLVRRLHDRRGGG